MRDRIADLWPFSKRVRSDDERPTDRYECPACGSLIIQPSSERCSQCGAATLTRR